MTVTGQHEQEAAAQQQQQSAAQAAAASTMRLQHLPNASSSTLHHQNTTTSKRASRRLTTTSTSSRSSHQHHQAAAPQQTSSTTAAAAAATAAATSSNNDPTCTSSHSAPGSPKIDSRKSTSTGASSAAVFTPHSYFHTLPEAQELKSSHDPLTSNQQRYYNTGPVRQHSDEYSEQESRMAPASSMSSSVVTSSGNNGQRINFENTAEFLSNTGNLSSSRSVSHSCSSHGLSSCASTTTTAAISRDAISPAVVAAVAAAGYDSGDSADIEQTQQQTSSNRSRQKKFMKNFKQLPQEEVVLQRYSCALVSDILLQGHLYITENYFAFHSNVFGYVTRLQIPVRSVTKITKEKTAKIIPNAVGVCTEDDVKHIFASLLSRDTTFKLMTRLWKRAIREAGRIVEEDLMLQTDGAPEAEAEFDDIICNDEESSDSEEHGSKRDSSRIPAVSEVSPMEQAYVVKRMNSSNGAVYYQPSTTSLPASMDHADSSSKTGLNEINGRRRSSLQSSANGGGGLLGQVSRSTVLSIFVVVLLIFLFCSSMYLVFRVDSLQRQVESRYPYKLPGDWPRMPNSEDSPEKIQKVLDDNVEQISSVRKSLEKLSNLIQTEDDVSLNPRDET